MSGITDTCKFTVETAATSDVTIAQIVPANVNYLSAVASTFEHAPTLAARLNILVNFNVDG